MAALGRVEVMNASPTHSKVRVRLQLSEGMFVAGQEVTGKMEVECRADKQLGLGKIGVELLGLQELTSRDHSAMSTFVHTRRIFQGPGLPPSNAVHPFPLESDGSIPVLPRDYLPARRGVTTFFFQLPTPLTSPATIDFRNGLARVKYTIRGTVDVVYRSEHKVVTGNIEPIIVESLPPDLPPEPQSIVLLEAGKIWAHASLIGPYALTGTQASLRLHLKNNSAKPIAGFSLSLTRTLHLSQSHHNYNHSSEDQPHVSDALLTIPFKGFEYTILPSSEMHQNLVFEIPKTAHGVNGRQRTDNDGRITTSLFDIRCNVEIKLHPSNALVTLVVPVLHPKAIPPELLPQEPYYDYRLHEGPTSPHPLFHFNEPPRSPTFQPASPASPSPHVTPWPHSPPPHGYFPPSYLHHHPFRPVVHENMMLPEHPYEYPVSAPVSPLPGGHNALYLQQQIDPYEDPTLNQFGQISPFIGAHEHYRWQYHSSPSPQQYTQENGARNFILQQYPLRSTSVDPPPPFEVGLGIISPITEAVSGLPVSPHTTSEHPQVYESRHGQGPVSRRISYHLRLSSQRRGRSVSPSTSQLKEHDPLRQHGSQSVTPISTPATPKRMLSVLSPRPIISPRHSFDYDSFGTEKAKGGSISENKAGISNGGSGKSGQSEPVAVLEAIAAEGAEDDRVVREKKNEAHNAINKTLPPPPVPSGKLPPITQEDVFSSPGSANPNSHHREANYRNIIEDDNEEDMLALLARAGIEPLSQTENSPMARLREKITRRGGLDALERRLLAEVGTRKSNFPANGHEIDTKKRTLQLPGLGIDERDTADTPSPPIIQCKTESQQPTPFVGKESNDPDIDFSKVAEMKLLRKDAHSRVGEWLLGLGDDEADAVTDIRRLVPSKPIFSFPVKPRKELPESKYDIRSARGGRGGIVASVAALWANTTANGIGDIKRNISTPSPLSKPKEKPSDIPKPPALLPRSPQTRIPGDPPLSSATRMNSAEAKSPTLPALLSSKMATPILSSTASLARPPAHFLPATTLPTISEVQTQPKTQTRANDKELVVGKARLKDLIKKYEGQR